MRIKSETKHYIIYEYPIDAFYGGQDHRKDAFKNTVLNMLEEIRSKGYRPLCYENRQQGFICEKPESEVKKWEEKNKSVKAA